MDMDPEQIQVFLNEVSLPSTLADLKNPTQDYVINLLTQFLNKFYIDLNAIIRPTPEQISSVSLVEDNAEIISLINLSEAMASICNQIFLKDFFLTDVTSPTPKKTRKLAKVLSNFVLYTTNKNAEIEERLEEMRSKRQRLEDINREKERFTELKRQKAREISDKIALKEQLEAEIARMGSLKGTRKAKIAELQEKLQAVQKEKGEIAQRHGNLTSEAIRMRKMTNDLESKLVRSPERYQSRLKELLRQKKNQTEKREVMQEAVISKKPAIERIQSHLAVVSNAHAKFPEITEAYKRLTKTKKILEDARKKVIEMNQLIEEETVVRPQEDSEASDALLQKAKDQCDQHLASIRNELTKLSNEKRALEFKLANDQNRQQDIFSKRDEIRHMIKKTEADTEQFITYCQEVYDNEINQQRKLKSTLEKNDFGEL